MNLADANVRDHAVERFIQRHRTEITFIDALRLLRAALPTARRLRERTHRGDELWLLPDLEVVVVVKRLGREQRLSCMTVLPANEVTELDDDDVAEVIAAAARAGAMGASR